MTLTLAETGAIVEFLTERFGQDSLSVKPATTVAGYEDRAELLYWLHWPEGSAMGQLIMAMIFGRIPKMAPFL